MISAKTKHKAFSTIQFPVMPNSTNTFLPPAKIGILGGGQLGRMSILAGRSLGYRFSVFEPKAGSPAGVLADKEVNEPYENVEALLKFAKSVDVVTLEFENIPLSALEKIQEVTPIYPKPEHVRICQNRILEKSFLQENGFPVTPFAVVRSLEDLTAAVETIGRPSVLKTAEFGYDGKGQWKITEDTDLTKVWNECAPNEAILEAWVNYRKECSVLGARNIHGESKTFPVAENIHTNHILDISIMPAKISDDTRDQAVALCMDLLNELDYVGLLALELFILEDGSLVVNELAPRPHNSGHQSIEGCQTSQFQQHIRAVTGLPLGETTVPHAVGIKNILGNYWKDGTPDWATVLQDDSINLHLYDKGEPKLGRKMGHFFSSAPDYDRLLTKLESL